MSARQQVLKIQCRQIASQALPGAANRPARDRLADSLFEMFDPLERRIAALEKAAKP